MLCEQVNAFKFSLRALSYLKKKRKEKDTEINTFKVELERT